MAAKKKISARKRRKFKLIIFLVELLILMFVLVALVISIKMSKMNTGEDIWDTPVKDPNNMTEEEKDKYDDDREVNSDMDKESKDLMDNYITIAMFGLDNRSNGNYAWGNSDVIMIASINKDTKEVKLVSVYRDTFMDIMEGDGLNKVNAAFARGGAAKAIKTLNANLDLNIEDYVAVDFMAIATAVDLLGGVQIEITDAEAHYMIGHINEVAAVTGKPAHQLPGAGTYNLDGVQAVAYCRVRQTAGSDYKRTERQRLVVQKMVEKALQSNIGTINALVDELFPLVETSLTQKDILMLGKDVFSYSLGEMSGFPFEKQGTNIGKYDCVVAVDLMYNVQELHKFLFDNPEHKVSNRVKSLSEEISELSGIYRKEEE